MKWIAGLGWIALACVVAYGQPPAAGQPSFEVASVKLAAPPTLGLRRRIGCTGGPGRGDPGLLTCTNISASNLVTLAYGLAHYQLSYPDWMDTARFDITAKIPPGTTKEQFQLMEQNLLAERFKLTVHHETKELEKFELTVGKNGPKLKVSVKKPAPKESGAAASPAPPIGRPKLTMGSDGLPVFPAGANMMVMIDGRARWQQTGETMQDFARFLSAELGRPVTDSTGLTGKYDMLLSWATDGMRMAAPPPDGAATPPDAADPLPTLVQAVQSLGLKLEPKKGPIDLLVIDHMDKSPAEN
ncbi:MAG TPA: TIGR03435 family protein [Bryobacteraceae bacterium]|nr:TIGR03435 family protein [Bryobacteraceae bacterium]